MDRQTYHDHKRSTLHEDIKIGSVMQLCTSAACRMTVLAVAVVLSTEQEERPLGLAGGHHQRPRAAGAPAQPHHQPGAAAQVRRQRVARPGGV